MTKQNPSPARRWVTKEGDPVEAKLGEIGKINLRKWVQHDAASPRGASVTLDPMSYSNGDIAKNVYPSGAGNR